MTLMIKARGKITNWDCITVRRCYLAPHALIGSTRRTGLTIVEDSGKNALHSTPYPYTQVTPYSLCHLPQAISCSPWGTSWPCIFTQHESTRIMWMRAIHSNMCRHWTQREYAEYVTSLSEDVDHHTRACIYNAIACDVQFSDRWIG